MASKAPPAEEGPSPLDIIFACSVCGDTFSDVYEGRTESAQGISDGINPKDRPVSRLYVSACCHVICIKHIEGGNGPPFHPAGQHPRAPCPVCAKDGGEEKPRELYAIRGFKQGEYDPAIPKFWFTAPPMKLDRDGKEMEALRFQYLALIRYGRKISATHHNMKRGFGETQEKLQETMDIASAEHAKVLALEQEVQRLRLKEQDLQRFKARVPAIEHFLRLVPKLVEQRERLQERLAMLGFHMALEPIPNFGEPLPLDTEGNFDGGGTSHPGVEQQHTASSHTVGSSAHNTGHAEEVAGSSSPQTSRPKKRIRTDSSSRPNNIHAAPSSRDLMPPPSKPLSRMRSVRKLIPSTIRKKFSGSKANRIAAVDAAEPDVQMFGNGYWETVDPPAQPSSDRERPPSRHGDGTPQGPPCMSGALPVENAQQTRYASEMQPLSNVDLSPGQAEFTFRSPSPIKMDGTQANRIPAEPSYIRLMDGLGRDNGLNLGLQDPRGRSSNQTHQTTQVARSSGTEHDQASAGGQQTSGYASPMHTLPTYSHADSLRSYPANTFANQSDERARVDPVTPASIRHQRPAQEVDQVVSPFFRSSSRYSPQYSRSQVAERQNSMIHSSGYLYHQQPEPLAQGDWRGRRSLNGLSFFDSPLNQRNEPIERRYERRPTQYITIPQKHQPRNLDSRGFITRSHDSRSPCVINHSYNSFDRSLNSRQQPVHPQPAIPFPSFSRASQSRAAPPPSAMPSIVSSRSRSPIRNSSQLQGLEQTGVRSSRPSHTHISGNTFSTPARTLFSSSGRRSIRR
ncbi:hypothetical protein K458DRAFT_354819 [Lentithecium fluviatile CBS 122367]|uniref:Uncharacterized protein n=1 Tax=Lentithecium fluviatile CBS 122367 TaxID=1168545 RepID=A0A6G1JJA2_9PLEO|nr:hypothetical protein K458DRAFT_354819 [Lentithecium fluviatile CBS 122367]